MALWQYAIRIVPKGVLMTWKGAVPVQLSAGEFTELPSFELTTLKRELFYLIESQFAKRAGSRDDIIQWGQADETDFCLSYEDHNLADLLVRLDIRTIKKENIELICKIGCLLEAVIITENGYVLEPFERNLIDAIKSSKAFRFVSNPRGFFDSH